jgi:spore cortex formation protein SpoVR/YcgB (stage V sporulation)
MLEHHVTNGILLAESDADRVLQHLANLWGYEVCLGEVEREGGKLLKQHRAAPKNPLN